MSMRCSGLRWPYSSSSGLPEGPQTLDEEGGKRGGYLGCCGALDGDVLQFGFGRRASAAGAGDNKAVGGDVAEEEEFLACGVVSDEDGRGLVVAQRVILAMQHGHRLDLNVWKDRSVPLVMIWAS